MYNVIGVRFKKAGKIYYFDPEDLPIAKMIISSLRLRVELNTEKSVTEKNR